jgi:hemolysin III
VSVSIYGASLILLYLASTFYHAISKPTLKAHFSLIDHCAIYLLIAGSYTPFLLITLKGSIGWTLFGIVWGMAIIGISLKVIFKERLKIFRVVTYVIMGWLVVFAGKTLIARLQTGGIILLASGGAIYTLGVFFYIRDHIRFNHAIWHLFVLGGSLCHFFAIYYYVLPSAPA